MKKLKILFKILSKEFLGKIKINNDKKQIVIYSALVGLFVITSLSYIPGNNPSYEDFNNTIILGFLQIFPVSIISYIFSYLSIDFSFKLNNFFRNNFIEDKYVNILKKILILISMVIFSIFIILIQAGIPLIQMLKLKLFFKFMMITILGISIMFIIIDTIIKFLEKIYTYMDINKLKSRSIILLTLSLLYIAVYYTVLMVSFNRLKVFDFYNKFLNLNYIYILLIMVISSLLILFYIFKFNNNSKINLESNSRYYNISSRPKNIKYTKYMKLLMRGKRLILTQIFIISFHLLNYFTIRELSISYLFSFLMVVIGLNFYSYLESEEIFLKLNNKFDNYKIFISLLILFPILNFPYLIILDGEFIGLLESFMIYIISIYIGIIFPRDNNSLNKFMSNFSLTIISVIIILSSFVIQSERIKLVSYLFLITLLSYIILSLLRRTYEEKNS